MQKLFLRASQKRIVDQLAEDLSSLELSNMTATLESGTLQVNKICRNLSAEDWQHLCESTSRCSPAMINKCTSIMTPSNTASCHKNQVSQGAAGTAPGTGIFFSHAFSSEWTPELSIMRLAHLATVACDSEHLQSPYPGSRRLSTILKPGKDLKKRRTPRKLQFKAFEALQIIPDLEMTGAKSWPATLNLLYSTTHFQTKTCEFECSDHISADSSISLAQGSGKECGSGGPSTGSSLPGKRHCATLGKSASRFSKKGRRKPETRVERYAKTILKFVGEGSVPEKLIRLTLGNNPDTSKALRLLLAHRKLKRLGEGGKGSAYVYLATPTGLEEIGKMTPEDPVLCMPPQP